MKPGRRRLSLGMPYQVSTDHTIPHRECRKQAVKGEPVPVEPVSPLQLDGSPVKASMEMMATSTRQSTISRHILHASHAGALERSLVCIMSSDREVYMNMMAT